MNKFILGLTLFSIVLLNSCVSKKWYTFRICSRILSTQLLRPGTTLKKNDRISIQVSAKSLELAAPFNTVAGA